MNAFNSKFQRYYLCGLIGLALWLQLSNLGALPLQQIDDVIVGESIQSIKTTGVPIMPSGNLYLRGLTFSYVASLFSLFGKNEFLLRLPNIPASIGGIILTYLIGRMLFSDLIGLLAATLYVSSIWVMELVLFVKNYLFFQFFFNLSLYLFYKHFFVREVPYGKTLIFFSIILSCLTHELGFSLCLLPVVLFIKRRELFFERKNQLYWGGALVCTFLIPLLIQKYHDYPNVSLSAGKVFISEFKIWGHLSGNHPAACLSVTVALYFIILYSHYRVFNKQKFYSSILFVLLSIIIVGLNLATLTLFAAFILFLSYNDPSPPMEKVFFKVHIMGLAIGLFFWFSYSYLNVQEIFSIEDIHIRTQIYGDIPYLAPLVELIKISPVMTFTFFAGVLFLAWKVYSRNFENNSAPFFFITIFFGSMLMVGIPKYDQGVSPRYFFHLYPLFLIFYIWTLCEFSKSTYLFFSKYISMSTMPHRLTVRQIVCSFIFLILLNLTSQNCNPMETYQLSKAEYGRKLSNKLLAIWPTFGFLDVRTPSGIIKDSLGGNDLVISELRVLTYYYVGRIDYRLKPGNIITGKDTFGKGVKYGSIGGDPLFEQIANTVKQNATVWIMTVSNRYNKILKSKYPDSHIYSGSHDTINLYKING